MPCDTRTKRGQTLTQRKTEVRKVVDTVASGLANGKVKAKVGPQGAIAFDGLTVAERDDVTDACVYRQIMTNGSSAAKLAIHRAEMLAGRVVDKQAVAQGHHSHDGGSTWHHGH